jgi:predicted CXXCH cytochrome family protein
MTHFVGHRRIRMFVATMDDGRLQVLPFMEEGHAGGFRGTFFDYTHLMFGAPGGADDPHAPPKIEPGFASFWTGRERQFDARCLRCHVSGIVPRSAGTRERPSSSSWRALGIDCESCHGPAAGHVAIYRGGEDAPSRDPMVARKSYATDRAVGVCTVCHMEADVVDPAFRPGDDVWEATDPILLDDPEQTDAQGRPFELVYAGIPFAVSECARAGKMTCETCHVAHGGTNTALMKWPAGSDQACASCHPDVVAAGTAHTHHDPTGSGARCVSCHMPYLTIERGHGFVADHTIGIPRLDAPGERVTEDACTWCHAGSLGAPKGAPAADRARLVAAYASWWPKAKPVRPWVQAVADGRRTVPGAAPALAKVAADEAAPPLARATAAWLLARYPDDGRAPLLSLVSSKDGLVRRRAVGALADFRGPEVDAALQKATKDPSAAVRRYAARAALEGWERVQQNRSLLESILPVLAQEAATVPDDDERWFRLGSARMIAGDLRGAVEAFERQVALDPFATHARETLQQLRGRLAPK